MKIIRLLFVVLFFIVSCREPQPISSDNQFGEIIKDEDHVSDKDDGINTFLNIYASGNQISVAIVGDSTSMGFGANGGDATWDANGLSYAFLNQPEHGYNWVVGHPLSLISSDAMITQDQQDNVDIPSAIRLLRTEIEKRNPNSKIYNYGMSGGTAKAHLIRGTIEKISMITPRPMVVLINLGINSIKNNASQKDDLSGLVFQAIQYDMIPVLVKPNNIFVPNNPGGNFDPDSMPNNWYPIDNWASLRNNIDEIALTYDLNIIDLGSDDGYLDETLLYDSFHPSAIGYNVIFEKYKEWFNLWVPDRD